MESWSCYKIEDLFEVKNGAAIQSKDFTLNKIDDSYMEVLKIGHIAIGGGLRKEPKKNYVHKTSKLDKFILQKGDIVMAMTDMKDNVTILGVSAMVEEDNKYILNQRVACLRKKTTIEFDDKFVYYQMRTRRFLLPLQKQANRGVQVNLTTDHIRNSIVFLPSLAEQKKISSLFTDIESKIDNNYKICKVLESQAQALFKNWFVDFAPFKNGQFVESELGMIPEGWRVGTLGDIAEFKRGKTITKSETKDGTIPVVAGGLEPAYYHNQSNTSSRVITISGSGANAGFIRMYYQPVWASDCSFLDDSSTSLLHTAYCYLKTNKKKVDALQWGAAQPHVYAKDINKLPFVIPPLEILNQFELLITEMFDCIEVNDKENLLLSNLRDTLLPKLMSGEIKV